MDSGCDEENIDRHFIMVAKMRRKKYLNLRKKRQVRGCEVQLCYIIGPCFSRHRPSHSEIQSIVS